MTALTLTLQTNEAVALRYRQSKKIDKAIIKAQLQRIMEHLIFQDVARKEMYNVLAELHEDAKNNGLTDDVLDGITLDNE
jgi:hypothetical protein